MLKLAVKSGLGKGLSWSIGREPLVIGRDGSCTVRIADPMVSRRHCEIELDGDKVRLTDLGSSNTTLVNGKAAKRCVLQPGDEIRIGQATFKIVGEDEEPSFRPRWLAAHSTVSVAEEEAVYLADESVGEMEDSGIHTVTDVLQLFRSSRAFSRMTSIQELVESLEKAIRLRFDPACLWIGLLGAHAEGLEYVVAEAAEGETPREAPQDLVDKVLEELRGFLTPERVRDGGGDEVQLTMAAPIYFVDQRIGVIVLQDRIPRQTFDETDLHYLVALAHAAAPSFGAIEQRQGLEREVQRLRLAAKETLCLVGGGTAIEKLHQVIRQVAPSMHSILIIGETGTGKELAAQLVHRLSDRADGPLVTVNCAAIPNDLIESELFGYEKGAFTGADRRKTGLFEQADGGTLFLDEVGDLSPESQARILRALETRRFRPVGGKEEIASDFRVVAATNKDVSGDSAAGSFRRDLYHRLRGVELCIPPLRERREDIPELAEHFLEQARAYAKHPLRGFAEEALDYLSARAWPGNVRELKHCVEAAVTFSQHETITAEDLKLTAEHEESCEAPLPLAEVEKRHILRAIEYYDGRVVEAAKLLGIGKTKLYERLNEYRSE